MSLTFGILLFDGAEELDFAGPYEVFGAAALEFGAGRILTVSENGQPIRAAKGLRVLPDHAFDDAPALDVLVVPGGDGRRREMTNPAVLDYIRRCAATCRFSTSVCTGSFLLVEAGVARGRRVTTHWSLIEELEQRGDCVVVAGERFVADGDVVTAAGVSAGIDMSLWLLGRLRDPNFAREVQRYIEYEPSPPYA